MLHYDYIPSFLDLCCIILNIFRKSIAFSVGYITLYPDISKPGILIVVKANNVYLNMSLNSSLIFNSCLPTLTSFKTLKSKYTF